MNNAPAESRPAASPATLRQLIASHLRGADIVGADAPPLELDPTMEEAPQLRGCDLLEPTPLTTHPLGQPEPRFRAFLDGRQNSEALAYVRGIPLILGTVGAVIRTRTPARASTWAIQTASLLYAPLRHMDAELPYEVTSRIGVVDTDAAENGGEESSRHPAALARRAFHMIQGARERLEQALAMRWCAERRGEPLLVDGGISRIPRNADSDCLAGIIKSHRTMYLHGDQVERVLLMNEGERSSAFRIDSRGTAVASWYLRLRRFSGRDPLSGLVRVEVPLATFSSAAADLLSRNVLAEASPLSLPDPRWDRLLYGVRDCEMFLSAVM